MDSFYKYSKLFLINQTLFVNKNLHFPKKIYIFAFFSLQITENSISSRHRPDIFEKSFSIFNFFFLFNSQLR